MSGSDAGGEAPQDGSDPSGGGAKQRWVKPVLVVSLALNLLFAGLIAGSAWKQYHDQWRPRAMVLGLTIEEMLPELSAEQRALGERLLERLRNDVAPLRGELYEAREKALAALTASPYDEQAFSDAMARIRNIRERAREGRHDIVITFIRDMSDAGRERFMEIYKANRRGPSIERYSHKGE